jgi:protocatechuate 4,5-dioxygenase alpha chain
LEPALPNPDRSGGLVSSKQPNIDDIPGTVIFDGKQAMKGYALNKMCFSFNSAENRDAYRCDEEAYCDKFNLNAQQRRALKNRSVLELLEAGGNIYYLAKWAGIFGLNVQQIGAQQRGMTEDEFKDLLVRSGGD